MQIWFESKVQYIKVDEGGRERKVIENYMLDAVSFTDAEARMISAMREIIKGDFSVTDIKKSKISEVFDYESGEWWYKAVINIVTIDEEAGREKKLRTAYLVQADDIQQALQRLDDSLGFLVVPYVIVSVVVSTIVDVLPLSTSEPVVPENLRILSEDEKSVD